MLTKLTRVSSGIQNNTFLTPERFGAYGDGVKDDTLSLQSALDYAYSNNIKLVLCGGTYKVRADVLNIPTGVTLDGGVFLLDMVITNTQHVLFTMAGNNSVLTNPTILLNLNGSGDINRRLFVAHTTATSMNCRIVKMTVEGRYNESPMGFCHGVRLLGTHNSVDSSTILRCSMGVSMRGAHLAVTDSVINNNYLLEGPKQWTSKSMYWDGIVMEGTSYSTISGCTVNNNGQSGIYAGGNNSYSHNVRIINNTVVGNWNRGIDTGVSGTPTLNNNVSDFIISGNTVRNNRDPNIWVYKNNRTIVTGNNSTIDEEYYQMFGAYASATRTGVSISDGNNCVFVNNFISTEAGTTYPYVVGGTVGTVFGPNMVIGNSPYVLNSDVGRIVTLADTDVFTSPWTPVLRSGTGVTLVESTGFSSVTRDRVDFTLQVKLSAVSGSGSLSIGYVPGLGPSASLRMQGVVVNTVTGLKSTERLQAHLDDSSNISLSRVVNGNWVFDVASLIGTNTTLKISGFYVVEKHMNDRI